LAFVFPDLAIEPIWSGETKMEYPVGAKRALKLNERDNVATVVSDMEPGDQLRIEIPGGETISMIVKDSIPFGHKVALDAIKPTERVFKYGASIGIVTMAIAAGEHVHIHNLRSARAVKHD
jgi:altronate dehydratase small subunit